MKTCTLEKENKDKLGLQQSKSLVKHLQKHYRIDIETALFLNLPEPIQEVCKEACKLMNIKYYVMNDVAEAIILEEQIITWKIVIVFSIKSNHMLLYNMQWKTENPLVQAICYMDIKNYFTDIPEKNTLMNRKIWDLIANNGEDQIESGGWMNSYNRELFSKKEMDEFADNAFQKLEPYIDRNKTVLEIGCSAGITMSKVAHSVHKYCAIDLSENMILMNKQIVREKGVQNVELRCMSADDIDCFAADSFDVGILNSVIQCFAGPIYLCNILEKLIDKVKDGGVIYIGDVLDIHKRAEFEESLMAYKRRYPESNTKINTSHEIFFARDFFRDMQSLYDQIGEVEISDKIYTIENELMLYRFDVILKIDKMCEKVARRKKYQIAGEMDV